MRPAKLIETVDIPLADIDVSGRRRPVSEVGVQSLKLSLEALGLQNEIQVRRVAHQNGKLKLMAGGHRVEAFRQLGRETIRAKIWDCTDDWAALIEIDDNLAQADLNVLDLAVFLAERKTVYERMYPKAKHGGNRGNHHTGGYQNDILSFCQTMADSRAVSRKTIERLVAAGNALLPQEIVQLRSAEQAPSLSDLVIIGKCGDPADRAAICTAFFDGTAKSAKEVMERKKAPGAAKSDPAEDALKRLSEAFDRAPVKAQRRFVMERRGVLQILMGAETADVIPPNSIERG